MKKIFLSSIVSIFLLGFFMHGIDAAVSNTTVDISRNPAQINKSISITITAWADGDTDLGFISLYVQGERQDRINCNPGKEKKLIQQCSAIFNYTPTKGGSYTVIGDVEDDFKYKIGQTSMETLLVTATGAPPAPSSGADAPKISALNPPSVALGGKFSISGENLCNNKYYWGMGSTVLFTQEGITISTDGTTNQACTLIETVAPSSLQVGGVKIAVSTEKGVSNSLDLALKEPVTPSSPGQGVTTGDTSSSGVMPKGKLEVDWPPSPLGTKLTGESLTNLVQYLYEWGIGLGGFLAFIALIIAGFQYLTSVGNAGKMGDAMKRIQSAGWGLVLLFGAFIILNTINPQLTDLTMPPPEQLINNEWGFNLEGQQLSSTKPNTCKKVLLYPKANFGGSPLEGPDGVGINKYYKVEVGSMTIYSGCSVTLYDWGDCTQNAFGPYFAVSTTTNYSNIETGGVSSFGCVKVDQM